MAICGVIHSVFGGKPMLILGVAEPTIIMYTYLYSFAKKGMGNELYLAWAGWYRFLSANFNALLAAPAMDDIENATASSRPNVQFEEYCRTRHRSKHKLVGRTVADGQLELADVEYLNANQEEIHWAGGPRLLLQLPQNGFRLGP
ncbi:unnamed protein product [Fraxinus pennsylvanica]|uniref:Uncharacterized protein n=1 Tax=Fraxinus pennsylvanica TaxID=56036 RepID=A0AAD2EE73_9LAMI|nr:unnamed protein product [Fraxinus pennsylvanica]